MVQMPSEGELICHTENLVKCILILLLLIKTLENDLFFFLNNAKFHYDTFHLRGTK